jgi:hypothetical protein
MKPRDFSAETCPKLFNVEYSTAVGLLVKGIEYMESLYESRAVINPEPVEPDGKESDDTKRPDPKPDDNKPQKKNLGLLGWFNEKFKSFFTEDPTTSKL